MESLNQSHDNASLLQSQAPADGNNEKTLDKEMRDFLAKMDNWSQNCQELEDNLQESTNLEAHESRILIVGDTDAGKSTLAHGLVGVGLECFIHPQKRIKVIDCINIEDRERLRIGHTQNSETKIPLRVRGPNNLILYDCCGFKDTEGAGDEIQNILYIKALAAKLKRAKIILTISEPKVIEKTGILKQFEHMMKMFCNQELLKSSLYLVITKGTDWTTKESIQDIETNLHSVITQNQPNQNQIIEEVINSLIEKKRIGLFPKPYQIGKIDQAIFQDILAHIDQVPESDIGAVNIEISAEAETFLNKALIKLNECIGNQLKEISKKVISKLCNEKIDIAQDLTQVYRFCGLLLNEKIPLSFSGPSNDAILGGIINFADNIIEISNNNETITDCNNLKKYTLYLKELLEICPENPLYCDNWNQEANSLRKAIEDIRRVSGKITGNTLIFRAIVMSALQIKKGIEEKGLKNLKRVEVYCQNTFFLDEDLILPGVDLLIISPTWVMYAPAQINLSGKEQTDMPERSENKDGEPGLPGRNSGNFVGVCKKFMGLSFKKLKLILKGGKGGKGLNGRFGGPGSAGADGDLDRIKNRDPSIMKSKEILYRPTSMAYSMLTWNATFSEVYESKGEDGQNGEDGGRGGSGGFGGKGGYAYFFIGEEPVALSDESLQAGDGGLGEPGAGGDGGPGGDGGKTYEARYFNDIVLPEFRDKDYWRSKRIPKKILNGPRTVSRCVMHAGMIATKVTFPVFLPAIALLQFGMSWHLANINSHWKNPPESCFKFENEGEQGQTPEEKNYDGLINPQPNNFEINHEKAKLCENYINDYSVISLDDPLKCIKKPIHII